MISYKNFGVKLSQADVWEQEYQKMTLLTGGDKPQKDVTRFLRFLRKIEKVDITNLRVLDLGSGTGRNANYLSSLGNDCVGLEISDTAIKIAQERAQEEKLNNKFIKHDIGSICPFADNEFDLILDIVSSNSLNEKEREIYLKETHRVLKNGGYFLVKALCKDGDKNAKNLLKISPGPEKDTYIIKELELIERVFSREDFFQIYSTFFKILELKKKISYTHYNNQNYKRNFWIGYLKKINYKINIK